MEAVRAACTGSTQIKLERFGVSVMMRTAPQRDHSFRKEIQLYYIHIFVSTSLMRA